MDLGKFDNSGRWWLGASVALASTGFTVEEELMDDAGLIDLWKKLHTAGRV